MTILLTGASGFLGTCIQSEMDSVHRILTIGRQSSNTVQCDLAVQIPHLETEDVDAVIHAAGKAHIYPKTEAEKQAFFDINVQGTEHLLASLENKQIKKFVFVSSVSVYGLGKGQGISEEAPLLGQSPYALSKIQAEQLIINWCKKKQIPFLIVRLPLVVGPHPLGNLGKMIQAIQKGTYLRIAKGDASKSMVLASDVAHLFSQWLSAEQSVSGIFNLTDGHHPTFFELEEALKTKYNKRWIPTIPSGIAHVLGKLGDNISIFPVNSQTIEKITCTFTFSDEKARKVLHWHPHPILDYYK
jgi:nucleoside-diphosphate-sugar epimerase